MRASHLQLQNLRLNFEGLAMFVPAFLWGCLCQGGRSMLSRIAGSNGLQLSQKYKHGQ